MPDAGFVVEVVRGVPVVAAPEGIDITNADGLRMALLEAAARGPATLVVDMTRTNFCDTAALHALVSARKRAQAEGGEVLLVIAGAAVQRIFAITGLDRVFLISASLEEALAQAPAVAARPPRPGGSPGSGPLPGIPPDDADAENSRPLS
jgi:anti-sigma B factor antagonist